MKNAISIAMMALFSLCCAAQNISVQSINYPTRYLRHSDSKGYLGEMLSDLDRQDASFKLVNAGIPDCPNCIRFESVNYPGQYLRHSNYLIWLSALSSDLDYKDASFRLVQGLAGTDRVQRTTHADVFR
ncbi:MAG: AbfB domain-containing protein [Phycisphaerae bacterium]|nr:AbfB domain-containing protein [Saprospiraceae bacterium]